MRGLRLIAPCLALLAGCDSLSSAKVDNPVLGPPPPRMALNDGQPPAGTGYVHLKTGRTASADVAATEDGAASILPTDFEKTSASAPSSTPSGSQVVATVNGRPIFAAEVLDRYSAQLKQAEKQMSKREFEQARESLIQRDLSSHVERKLLVTSLRSTLDNKKLEQLDQQLDSMFDKETAKLREQLKVNSNHELEIELNKQQTSLASLKDAFVNQRLAMEYLSSKAPQSIKAGRQELHDYYVAHLDDYAVRAQVRWQEITVSFDKHGGKPGAAQALEEAVAELKRGVDFAEVARKHSDGPTAAKGGAWDWTQRGSLADSKIEELLFTLPVGTISQPLVGKDGLELVRVVERREAHHTPFHELQDEIRETLEVEARKKATMAVLEQMKKDATIVTIFDGRKDASADAGLPFQ